MNNLVKGLQGEDIAVEHLIKQQYIILERNFRYKKSEIDIIALKEDTLVFIEVKMRNKTSFGYPEEFVSTAQEERILNASTFYLEQAPPKHKFIRFDIIAIIGNKQRFSLTHIKDAFH